MLDSILLLPAVAAFELLAWEVECAHPSLPTVSNLNTACVPAAPALTHLYVCLLPHACLLAPTHALTQLCVRQQTLAAHPPSLRQNRHLAPRHLRARPPGHVEAVQGFRGSFVQGYQSENDMGRVQVFDFQRGGC
jgi:hypothetical protein